MNPARGDGTTGTAGTLDATRTPPPAVLTPDTVMQQAVDRFEQRVEVVFHHDALSLARGQTPIREDSQLTDAQRDELQHAVEDLVRDVPFGALSPDLAARLQSGLDARHVDRDLATTRLKDLGHAGGDFAREWAKDLRHSSPAEFYALASGAAAAIGYVGYTKGSDGLKRLGLRPEVKTTLFDDRLTLRARPEWDPRFQNVHGSLTAEARLGDTSPGAPDFRLSAGFNRDQNGVNETMLGASYRTDTLSATATATFGDGGLRSAAGAVWYHPTPDFSLSAGASYTRLDNRVTATGEALWKVNPNVDFALSASTDNRGDSYVGAGVVIHF